MGNCIVNIYRNATCYDVINYDAVLLRHICEGFQNNKENFAHSPNFCLIPELCKNKF